MRIGFLFLIALFLTTQNIYANNANYRFVGGKSLSEDATFGDYIGNQLYQEFEDKNRIFKETDIKFNFDFSSSIDLETKWFRRVHNKHESKSSTYTPRDHSKLIVINSLYAKIRASKTFGPINLGSGAEYGVLFSVGKLVTPDDSNEGSPYANNRNPSIVNATLAKSDINQLMTPGKCTICINKQSFISRTFAVLGDIWKAGVGQAENVLSWIVKPFIDNEKFKEYNKNPLEALKLLNIYGLPLDVNVFSANDERLQIGDIVKHTSFFTFRPVTVGSEFLWIKSNGGLFARFIEEISLVKKANNKVILQAKFITSLGGRIQWAKLRPSLSIGPGYTILDWEYEDYENKQNKYLFEFDISQPEARERLQSIINNNYLVDLINFKNQDDLVDLPRGVTFINKIKTNAKRHDKSYYLKLPLLTRVRTQNLTNHSKETFESEFNRKRQYRSEKLIGNERNLNRWWKLWDRKDIQLRSHVKVQTGSVLDVFATPVPIDNRDYVLTFTSLLKNKYGNHQLFEDLISMEKRILNNTPSKNTYDQLRQAAGTIVNNTPVNWGLTLTFNKEHVQNMINLPESEVYKIAAEVFLGEKHKDEWNNNRREWSKSHPNNRKKSGPKRPHISRKFKCLKGWENAFKKLSANPLKSGDSCYSLYRWTSKFVSSLNELKHETSTQKKLKGLISNFNNLIIMPPVQLLMAKLAGGYNPENTAEPVKYLSEFFVQNMVNKMTHINGPLYHYPDDFSKDVVDDIENASNSSDRLRSISFYVDLNSHHLTPDYYVEIKSLQKFEQAPDHPMTLKMDFRRFVPVLKDEIIFENYFERLPQPTKVSGIGWEHYRYFFKLSPPDFMRNKLNQLINDKKYTVLATVVNDEGSWVSEQNEILLNTVKKREFTDK